MSVHSYTEGLIYETFIRYAHNCERGMRNGAEVGFMRNLIDAENGESHVSSLPPAEKQFETVKMYIIKAFDKYFKRKLTEEERIKLTSLRHLLDQSWNSQQLMHVVREAHETTRRLWYK